MDDKTKLEIVDGLRDFFLKCFWISFFTIIIVYLLSIFTFDYQEQLLAGMYDIESEDFSKIYVELFGIWKIIMFQFTLIPAVALWFMENKIKKAIEKMNS